MIRRELLVVLGLMGVAGLATGCGNSADAAALSQAQADIKALQAARKSDSTYLAENYAFLAAVDSAICGLEQVNQTVPGWPKETRLCKGNGPGDTKQPPPYPPAP